MKNPFKPGDVIRYVGHDKTIFKYPELIPFYVYEVEFTSGDYMVYVKESTERFWTGSFVKVNNL